jgi:methionyl-tRNA formyltransferase
MNVLFWGTPAYAVPSLNALHAAGHRLVGVVSQPDRRRGRGKELVASPVKVRALDLGIPVFTPERIRRQPELQAELAALGADLSVVVAFGQLLPPEVLAQPPLGCWNGHGSLLPRWRGAAPIQWSLIEGDAETGVGIMAMEAGLDTGPVLLERAIPIGLLSCWWRPCPGLRRPARDRKPNACGGCRCAPRARWASPPPGCSARTTSSSTGGSPPWRSTAV